MGTYYCVCCDELKEKIDPGDIDDLGVKESSIGHFKHPIGQITIFTLTRRWRNKSIRLANDSGNDDGYFNYEDVTKIVIEEYNNCYKTNIKYTGD
jgi:hypothetical protein